MMRNPRSVPISATIWIIALNSVVLLTLQQLTRLPTFGSRWSVGSRSDDRSMVAADTASSASSSSSLFGLVVPEGRATPLPSVRTTAEEEASIDRQFYGGKGDKSHLGGFTSFDPMGVSPTLWKHMMSHLGIRSLLDLGCGRGISTSWFVLHGLEYVVCAEGSHDAVEQSLLPKIIRVPNGTEYELVEHDFSRGAWWPARTVDVAWCVEFTEHVGRNYQKNYHTSFRKAALIFVTHSNWGGWHHVEVHNDDWWRVRMEAAGFVYSEILTMDMRTKAQADTYRTDLVEDMKRKNKTNYHVAQHLWTTLQVFINPLVASLSEHQHLFAEHGCYTHTNGIECGKAGTGADKLTPLPDSFKPLPVTNEMDFQWLELIRDLPLV